MNRSILALALGSLPLLSTNLPAAIVKDALTLPVLKEGAWDTLKITWNRPEKEESPWGNPLANNDQAAKIKGGVATEILQLNDKTFWSGWPTNTQDPKRKTALKETREKLAAGDIPGANQAARGMWGPHEVGSYMPLGSLKIAFDGHEDRAAKNYLRELDLDRAVSTVRYDLDGVTYTREAFASFPDHVIVMRVTASRPGKLTFTASFAYPVEMEGHAKIAVDGIGLVMTGKASAEDRKTFDPKKGMKFEARVAIKTDGGKVTPQGNTLRVENATSATFYYASATSYNGYLKEPGTEGVDPARLVKIYFRAALPKNYDQLLATHLADYRALFRRVWLQINNGPKPDPAVVGFQYARFDMIVTSRAGDRPHNQQGMWNGQWKAPSNCAHFLNENVQKYYGLIETANLAETGTPLWNWMDQLAERGAITAKTDWGFRGWMAPHYSDIWASTPLKGGNNEWTIWPMGGIWLCNNLWDHFAFSGDRQFLAQRAYPLMKGAAEFALDYLVTDKNGKLVTSPSSSPENQFRLVEGGPTYAVSQGATMDIALIRELFQNTITASTTLGVDAPFRAELQAALAKMLPYQIGKNGELQEWSQDFPKRDNGHRHASHVVTAWPTSQINEYRDPALFKAAILALDNRGGGGYHPDKAAMYARLKQGDKALAKLGGNGHAAAGQFPPLYSGLPELLLFSHNRDARGNYELELLPGLPSSWKSGKVSGLRGRGGYEVEIEWTGGKLKRARIDSKFGLIPTIRYEGKPLNLATDSRVTLNLLTPKKTAAITR